MLQWDLEYGRVKYFQLFISEYYNNILSEQSIYLQKRLEKFQDFKVTKERRVINIVKEKQKEKKKCGGEKCKDNDS